MSVLGGRGSMPAAVRPVSVADFTLSTDLRIQEF